MASARRLRRFPFQTPISAARAAIRVPLVEAAQAISDDLT
jgi:hypothetical protein